MPEFPRSDTGAPSARFGAQPLAQTREAAAALRRLTGLLLSQEHPHPAVGELLVMARQWENALSATAPTDNAPRVGDAGENRRIYLDHAFDIGGYNPCFPEYRFDRVDPERAEGRVNFPLPFEGPPGLVHGGFLGVFFDCVVQQHNCSVGPAGKTRSLTVTYRRPAPLLADLRFEIDRSAGERSIASTARLLLGDTVLCSGAVEAVAAAPKTLAGASYGERRPMPDRPSE
ncbi:PaaI family thioesterase [Nocardia nova]|uniref:PaaI family thioesterase n=1 Tax=Nocardia nova TaxID=37330 RepID=UPI0033D7AF2B